VLDNEPTDDNNETETSAAPSSDPPTSGARRRGAPPPVMAFMAPPEPDPVIPRQRAERESDTADTTAAADAQGAGAVARPVTSTRGTKKATAAKVGETADDSQPTKATRAAKGTKATKAAKSGSATTSTRAKKATGAAQSAAAGEAGTSVAGGLDQARADDITTGNLFESPPDDLGMNAGTDADADADADSGNRRKRGRRGRGRGKTGDDSDGDGSDNSDSQQGQDSDDGPAGAGSDDEDGEGDGDGGSSTRRRRRRRRRSDDEDGSAASRGDSNERGGGAGSRGDGGERGESARGQAGGGNEEVRGISGSTRLEAKRQRRRDGRETGRRRAPILSEAEFLTRREAVNRAMVIRQNGERTQIAVLEDDIVVEHYITQASSNSFAGNVYLGKVQNVLPSMEAAFVDIGKGRNAVLYAGEVNWDAAGLEGKSRNIETAMKSGDSVVVQVTKDPMGHKGARLTSQVSLPGRYLVYVPNGSMTGISRKLPDVERARLKAILKKIVPEDAGVIIRTAAEGASEEELTRDVNRLTAQWDVIQKKAAAPSTSSPSLLYQEPDLAIRVIRDVFNEDFTRMIVSGDQAWDTVEAYVAHVAPDLADRVSRHTGESDVFTDLRVDEQLAKALDRKVWLPSGGSLVIDRTEAMTVVDVNTGKYVGSGGNLEQTVTRNNLEAAEEIVRQLRLRDIGGIIVIDFIDMVLESNRDLVLRRLTECLGRDRTRHQVAEVTSLGLVQMTRKRVGQGLLEVYSESCEVCNGRGIIVNADPIDEKRRRSGGDSARNDSGRNADNSGSDSNGDHHRGGDRDGRSASRNERGGRGRGRGATSRSDSPAGDPPTVGNELKVVAPPEADSGHHVDIPPAQLVREAEADIAVALPPVAPSMPAPVNTSESADVRAWSEQEAAASSEGVTATPRRRGRRAASRPAGPPGADG